MTLPYFKIMNKILVKLFLVISESFVLWVPFEGCLLSLLANLALITFQVPTNLAIILQNLCGDFNITNNNIMLFRKEFDHL